MRPLSCLAFVVAVAAPGFADEPPGGVVADPPGDSVIEGGPDLASLSLCYTASELQVVANLFTPWGTDAGLFLLVDVDQNPATGVPQTRVSGSEFTVSVITQPPFVTVYDIVHDEYALGGSVTYGPSAVTMHVPLTVLGSDDGAMDAVAVVGPLQAMVVPISDEAPDVGLLTSVPCAGSVPTTSLPPTTTTLPSTGCAADGQCADDDPCTVDRCAGGGCAHALDGPTGAECEFTRAADGCSAKLPRAIARKLRRGRIAVARAALATAPARKARTKRRATSAIRGVAKMAATLAAKGKLSDACVRAITDATQRLIEAIAAI